MHRQGGSKNPSPSVRYDSMEIGEAWQTRPSESRVKKHLPQVGCPGGIKGREVMKKEAIAIMILPLK